MRAIGTRWRISGDGKTVKLFRWSSDDDAQKLMNSTQIKRLANSIVKQLQEITLERETFDQHGMTVTRVELTRKVLDGNEVDI